MKRQLSPSAARSVALVAGAGSGLGLATAVHLAARGWDVYGTTLSHAEDEALRSAAATLGVSVRPLHVDVTNGDYVAAAAQTVGTQAGRLDALVHFAGIGLRGFFEDLGLDEIRRVYDVNVFGTMAMTQAMLPLVRAGVSP